MIDLYAKLVCINIADCNFNKYKKKSCPLWRHLLSCKLSVIKCTWNSTALYPYVSIFHFKGSREYLNAIKNPYGTALTRGIQFVSTVSWLIFHLEQRSGRLYSLWLFQNYWTIQLMKELYICLIFNERE